MLDPYETMSFHETGSTECCKAGFLPVRDQIVAGHTYLEIAQRGLWVQRLAHGRTHRTLADSSVPRSGFLRLESATDN